MQGQQCLRLLWLSTNKLLPEKTVAEKQKLEQGHEFEEYAHKLFPDAVNLAELEFEDILKRDKTNLDLFWVKDESLDNLDKLPKLDVIANELVEDLQSALEQLKEISEDLD